MEERFGERESLKRGLLAELGPEPGAPATRLGGGDPLEATRLWVGDGVSREATRL